MGVKLLINQDSTLNLIAQLPISQLLVIQRQSQKKESSAQERELKMETLWT